MKDYWGNRFDDNRLIDFEEKKWFLKKKKSVNEFKRDYLAWLLGKDFLNIAEVKPIDDRILTMLDLKETDESKWLVRIGESYKDNELIIHDLDKAVAYELVFSIWIRRRDTHTFNRVYTLSGLPVFFDHQTAFLGEPYLTDINYFFNSNLDRDGYASMWTVVVKDSSTIISTSKAQEYETSERPKTVHFINAWDSFEDYVIEAVKYIKNMRLNYSQLIKKAGFEKQEVDDISGFLIQNRNDLGSDVKEMFKVLKRNKES